MTDDSPDIPSAAADLAERYHDWVAFLQNEKHFSRHTLRAYTKDILYFFEFLTAHFGTPPSLNNLGDASLRDFRSWLSQRVAAGASNATRARQLSRNCWHNGWTSAATFVMWSRGSSRCAAVGVSARSSKC